MINGILSKKGFTLVELLVTVLILGLLVLLAAPKLLNYIDEAELARIQHDVKVMENKMTEVISEQEEDYFAFENNSKDLGTLVLRNQLFEKEGVATSVSMKHLLRGNVFASLVSNEIGGNLYTISDKGVGGNAYSLDSVTGYKIVPESYKKTIGTHLKGTFYVNSLGKVYYEPDKPISSLKQEQALACVAAETLNYVFDETTGTIVKYNGSLQYITIPGAFLVDGKCVPVKIIGAGAFMNGNFSKIKIPQSVKRIEENAFKDNDLTDVEIPHSVDFIGPGAFSDNKIENLTIKKSSSDITVSSGTFSNNGSSGTSNISPTYKIPTASELKITFDKSTGALTSSYGSLGSGGSNSSGSGSSSSGGSGSGSSGDSGSGSSGLGSGGSLGTTYDNSNKVISIPKTILVDGEEHTIKQISKGAFQGQGIIFVEFPDSLERIEDYAFAGNQIIGVNIPSQIGHIGNYAFAFNEINEERTIDYVNIINEYYQNSINNVGDIAIGGVKVNLLKDKVALLDQIFVTSKASFEIPEEYNPITKINKTEVPGKPQVNQITETSAVITGASGTEVRINNGEWKDSPHTFASLSEGTSYTAYARFKETQTHFASKVSEGSQFSTEEGSLYYFSSGVFNSGGNNGKIGPSQHQINNGYKNTSLANKVNVINGIQYWTVPKTGNYRIETYGASAGGDGAVMKGDFSLIRGQVLNIIVGQQAGGHGGAGGSFVWTENTPLIISGGGGGSGNAQGASNEHNPKGKDASTSINGVKGNGSGAGGLNGGAGKAGGGYGSNGLNGSGGGGSGWNEDAIGGAKARGGEGGQNGGPAGAFGGGGSSWLGGGGGGGYSGGGGGTWGKNTGAGGGGSYNVGSNQLNSVGNIGSGKVIITHIGQ